MNPSSNEIFLSFDINPVPASRPRVTRWATFYSKKYTDFKNDMSTLLDECKSYLKDKATPFTGPLHCTVTFLVEIPKSYSKKKTAELENQYCMTNIDIDNLEKAIYDSLNGIVFEDDRQIVHHDVKKMWTSGKGKIIILIKKI